MSARDIVQEIDAFREKIAVRSDTASRDADAVLRAARTALIEQQGQLTALQERVWKIERELVSEAVRLTPNGQARKAMERCAKQLLAALTEPSA
jgi:hypothetical protein